MTIVTKQDSNFTGLSYAVEQSPGVLPGSPVWFPLEPNSYSKYGADVKTKQRQPINAARQLKKAVVVDLDANGGFQQDLTGTNFQDLSQCFMFALFRKKNEFGNGLTTGPAAVNSTHSYTITAGDVFFANDLIFAKQFVKPSNNGLKTVSSISSPTSVVVTDVTIADEAVNGPGVISRIGYQFGSGELSLTNSGTAYPTLNVTTVAGAQTLTTTGVFANAETVTIGGEVYTMLSVLVPGAGNVKIAGSTALTLTNLANAINQTGAGVPGTDYDTANTPANNRVTATSTATTLVVTAIASGLLGNAITTTKTAANATWGAATLAGGSGGRGLNSFGFIPGEFIFVGSDEANTSFATAVSNGFMRVRSVAAGVLTLDKTQFETITDAGAGKTMRIYFGRVLKNESNPNLQVKRTIMLERTLGYTDDALPTQVQAEYLTASLANTMKLSLKSADIIRLDLDFLSNTSTFNTSAQGVKTGARPALVSTDAYNSTSDVHFSRMSVMSTLDGAPTPLFAFITDLTIDLKNNVKQNKAVSVLGAFSSTAGFFQVAATVTAYFQNVAELQSVINNASITQELHMVKFQQGVSIDLPLLVLSQAMADVKINEPIKIPLKSDASSAENIDPNLAYTMLWVFWDYLPLAA